MLHGNMVNVVRVAPSRLLRSQVGVFAKQPFMPDAALKRSGAAAFAHGTFDLTIKFATRYRV